MQEQGGREGEREDRVRDREGWQEDVRPQPLGVGFTLHLSRNRETVSVCLSVRERKTDIGTGRERKRDKTDSAFTIPRSSVFLSRIVTEEQVSLLDRGVWQEDVRP